MPEMTIRLTNSTFASVATGRYDTDDDAYRAATRAALDIAADEVASGAASSIVHVVVEDDGGRVARRGAVSAAAARLLP